MSGHDFANAGRTDGRTDGRTTLPMGICWVFLLFKTTQQAKNYPIRDLRNEWKVLTYGHLLGSLVSNKCPSVCPDGQTEDMRHKGSFWCMKLSFLC